MNIQQLQLLAGTISSVIFAAGTCSMLFKTWRTHDVDSYSILQLILNNLGNGLYWIYVLSLPVGPIYYLHGFYTVSTILMLIWYVMYHTHPEAVKRLTMQINQIKETVEMTALRDI